MTLNKDHKDQINVLLKEVDVNILNEEINYTVSKQATDKYIKDNKQLTDEEKAKIRLELNAKKQKITNLEKYRDQLSALEKTIQ